MNIKTFLDLSGTPTPKSYGMNYKRKKTYAVNSSLPTIDFSVQGVQDKAPEVTRHCFTTSRLDQNQP